MLVDVGETLTRGEDEFLAVIDNAERVNEAGQVIGRELRATFAACALAPPLADGAAVTRAGQTYLAREVMDDGQGAASCVLVRGGASRA